MRQRRGGRATPSPKVSLPLAGPSHAEVSKVARGENDPIWVRLSFGSSLLLQIYHKPNSEEADQSYMPPAFSATV